MQRHFDIDVEFDERSRLVGRNDPAAAALAVSARGDQKAFGMIAGPATGLVRPDALFGDLLFPLVSLGVAVILFEGALTLRVREIRGQGEVVRNMVTFGALLYAIARWQRSCQVPGVRLLLCFAVPLLGFMTVQGLLSQANANWAAAAYVSATVAVVALMDVPAEPQVWIAVVRDAGSDVLLIDGRVYAFDGTSLVDQGVDASFTDSLGTGTGTSVGCGTWGGSEHVALRYTYTYEGGNSPDTATVMHVTVQPLLAPDADPDQYDLALPADIQTAVEIVNGWCDGLPVRTG